MCEFEFCLVEELCEDLLAMRMRDYLGRLDGRLEDGMEDAGCGTTTKDAGRRPKFIFYLLTCGGVLCFRNKVGVVENVEIID